MAKKKAVKKKPARAGTAKKKTVARQRASKPAPKKRPAPATQPRAAAARKPVDTGKPLSAAELRHFEQLLRNMRDKVVDEISFLAGDNLNRSQRESSGDLSSYSIHMADQGTDNFDREFALSLVSSEQDAIYEIDEALQRIKTKSFGVCQMCEKLIERARLEALPFARMCVSCKSESERGRARYRPFGPSFNKVS